MKKTSYLLFAICSALLVGLNSNASAQIIIANAAADYVASGDAALPAGWTYFFSSAATGGTEVALTPNIAVGLDGQMGFGSGSNFNVAAIDGTNDNGGDFELFNNSNTLWRS